MSNKTNWEKFEVIIGWTTAIVFGLAIITYVVLDLSKVRPNKKQGPYRPPKIEYI